MSKQTIFESDNTEIAIENINGQIFRIHAKSKFRKGYNKNIIISKEQLITLRDFLNKYEFEEE